MIQEALESHGHSMRLPSTDVDTHRAQGAQKKSTAFLLFSNLATLEMFGASQNKSSFIEEDEPWFQKVLRGKSSKIQNILLQSELKKKKIKFRFRERNKF